jgi:spoIIIJ-associated protein
MPIADKIATAKRISELLNMIIKDGDFRLKYRIMVDPPIADDRDWEKPDILVDLSGSDSSLLLERGGELLRSFECVVMESLRLSHDEHEKVAFDCMNFRRTRIEELRMAAEVAAAKVVETGRPYPFQPMSSRERRIVHLALKNNPDLRTESEGEGPQRHLVVYPKNYQGKAAAAPMRRRR